VPLAAPSGPDVGPPPTSGWFGVAGGLELLFAPEGFWGGRYGRNRNRLEVAVLDLPPLLPSGLAPGGEGPGDVGWSRELLAAPNEGGLHEF